jgi:hypothetical protein
MTEDEILSVGLDDILPWLEDTANNGGLLPGSRLTGDQDASMAYSTVQRHDGNEPPRRSSLGSRGCKEENVFVLSIQYDS